MTAPPAQAIPTSLPARARRATPLLSALALGLAAHALTWGAGGFGLNLPVLVALVLGLSVWALWRRGETPSAPGLALLAVALAFAGLWAVRDAPPQLEALNGLALLLALGLGTALLRFPAAPWGVLALLGTALTAGGRVLYGPALLLDRFPWTRLRGQPGGAPARAALGVLLSVPVLLVFGGLLGSADAGFGRLFERLWSWSPEGLLRAAWSLGLWTVLAGGLVYGALLSTRPSALPTPREGAGRLGLIEVGLPLASLSALFFAFVGTQLPYFLSGNALPEGLTYAEYIRKGFGELLTVAFLCLALLLGAFGLTRPAVRAGMAYRLLNLAVLLPLLVVIASAAHRWRLYTLAYGLSEIRVLGAAFLVWVTLSLGLLAWGLWRAQVRAFAPGALGLGFATLLTTTALDPAALIARVNLHRHAAGVTNALRTTPQQANVWELLNLGDGAVPVVVANLNTLAPVCGPTENCARPNLRAEVLEMLQTDGHAPRDARAWTLAHARAQAAVQALERDAAAEATPAVQP